MEGTFPPFLRSCFEFMSFLKKEKAIIYMFHLQSFSWDSLCIQSLLNCKAKIVLSRFQYNSWKSSHNLQISFTICCLPVNHCPLNTINVSFPFNLFFEKWHCFLLPPLSPWSSFNPLQECNKRCILLYSSLRFLSIGKIFSKSRYVGCSMWNNSKSNIPVTHATPRVYIT